MASNVGFESAVVGVVKSPESSSLSSTGKKFVLLLTLERKVFISGLENLISGNSNLVSGFESLPNSGLEFF